MEWRNNRVLVTGASGVIGRTVVQRLAGLDVRLLAVDIAPGDAKGDALNMGVDRLQADLSRADLGFIRAFDPHILFHLAATFERTEETPDFWESNFAHNLTASHRLLQAVQDCQSLRALVFASSYLIYDPKLYLDVPKVHPLMESEAIAPRNLVGLAKYFTERELDFVGKTAHQFRTISARIFRVYGRGSRDVISRWIRSALRGETIEVYNRDGRFDYIYADDVAEGLIKLAESPGAQGIVNLGFGTARSVADVVEILRQEFPGLQLRHTSMEGSSEGSCANMKYFSELTKWIPPTSLEQGIRQVVAYEMAKQSSRPMATAGAVQPA